MSKKTIILSIILTGILLISAWAFIVSSQMTKDIKKAEISATMNNDDVKVDDLIITETKSGKKFWEMYAESGSYVGQKEQALLKNVKGNFYKGNKVIMSFEAPVGIYSDKNKKITLSNGVKVATGNDVLVSAKEITWTGHNDQIIAKGDVKMKKSDQLLTYSDISFFNTEFTKFKIAGKSKANIYTNGSRKR